MKIDPYNHEGSLTRWKNKVRDLGKIPDLSRHNSSIILKYLTDMELGINTSLSSKKGARSFTRLNTIRTRLIFLAKKFEELLKVDDMTKLTEQQVCTFFVDMRKGVIKRQDGRRYKATRDFVKIFKAFGTGIKKSQGRRELRLKILQLILIRQARSLNGYT